MKSVYQSEAFLVQLHVDETQMTLRAVAFEFFCYIGHGDVTDVGMQVFSWNEPRTAYTTKLTPLSRTRVV